MGRDERLAQQVSKEREALRRRLRSLSQLGKENSGARPASRQSESADEIQQKLLREQDRRTYEIIVARIKALDRALDRLREGTYGICQRCGQPIPQQRLMALPDAIFCVSCQEQME